MRPTTGHVSRLLGSTAPEPAMILPQSPSLGQETRGAGNSEQLGRGVGQGVVGTFDPWQL